MFSYLGIPKHHLIFIYVIIFYYRGILNYVIRFKFVTISYYRRYNKMKSYQPNRECLSPAADYVSKRKHEENFAQFFTFDYFCLIQPLKR